MFSPFMMLLGFIFSVGMIVLIEWLDNETKIKVSIFNMVMVATGTYGDGLGDQVEPGTYVNATEGYFRDGGLTHFFTQEEAKSLFEQRFSDVQIEHSTRSINNQQHWYKHWVIEAAKNL